MADNALIDIYTRAHRDLCAFRELIQCHDAGKQERLPPAEYHKRWAQELLYGSNSIACEGFRECGKSSIIKAYILYCLTFPTKDRAYLAIMRANKTSAIKALREIAEEYLRSPLMREASLGRVLEQSADAFCIETRQGVVIRIESYGKGSAIRGATFGNRRPDVVILDDIQDKDEMRGDTVPEADWDWFLSDVAFLGKSTRFFMIGNNLGDRCIIERIINGAVNGIGFGGFRCYRVPAMENGVAAWKERFSVEYLDKEREDMRKQGKLDVWLMERMCQSVSDETRVFKREDFRYFDSNNFENKLRNCNVFACLDPASSTNPDACYRSLIVVAVDSSNNWFIIDCAYGRWDSVAMIDEIFGMVRKWHLKSVGIEKGHYQQVIEPFITKEMSRRNVWFDIVPLEHAKRGSKLERISKLAPRYRAHNVYHPQDMHFVSELETELLGVTRAGFKSQYVDLVDSLAMVSQIADVPVLQDDADERMMSRESYFDTTGWKND